MKINANVEIVINEENNLLCNKKKYPEGEDECKFFRHEHKSSSSVNSFWGQCGGDSGYDYYFCTLFCKKLIESEKEIRLYYRCKECLKYKAEK